MKQSRQRQQPPKLYVDLPMIKLQGYFVYSLNFGAGVTHFRASYEYYLFGYICVILCVGVTASIVRMLDIVKSLFRISVKSTLQSPYH